MSIKKEDIGSYAKITPYNLNRQEDIYRLYKDNLYEHIEGENLYIIYKGVKTNIIMNGNRNEGETINVGMNIIGMEASTETVFISPEDDMRDVSKEKFLNLVKHTIKGLMRWSYTQSCDEGEEFQYYHDTGGVLAKLIKYIISDLVYISRSIGYIEEEDVQAIYKYIISYHEETLLGEDEQEFNRESENEYEYFTMRVVYNVFRQIGEEVEI